MAQAKAKKVAALKAGAFTKRVGNTVYTVGVYYNENSKETVREKIVRLIQNETAGKAVKKR